MSTNRALLDSLECYMDDLVECFEDFVKKSLILVSVTAGAVIVLLVYILKVFTDRADPYIPIPNVTPVANFTLPTFSGALSDPPTQQTKRISNKRVQNDISVQSSPVSVKKNSIHNEPTVQYTHEPTLNIKTKDNQLDPTTNELEKLYSNDPTINKILTHSSNGPLTNKKIITSRHEPPSVSNNSENSQNDSNALATNKTLLSPSDDLMIKMILTNSGDKPSNAKKLIKSGEKPPDNNKLENLQKEGNDAKTVKKLPNSRDGLNINKKSESFQLYNDEPSLKIKRESILINRKEPAINSELGNTYYSNDPSINSKSVNSLHNLKQLKTRESTVYSQNESSESVTGSKVVTPRSYKPSVNSKSSHSLQSNEPKVCKKLAGSIYKNGPFTSGESINSLHYSSSSKKTTNSVALQQDNLPTDSKAVNTQLRDPLSGLDERMLMNMGFVRSSDGSVLIPFNVRDGSFTRFSLASLPTCSIQKPLTSRSHSEILRSRKSCCSVCCNNSCENYKKLMY